MTATIGLEQLVNESSLLDRVDRKYLLPLTELAEFDHRLPDGVRVLQIDGMTWFGYRSCYYDTPGLACYFDAGRRRRRRFKVRTREYLHTSQRWLEVKTRGPRGTTIKDRIERRTSDDDLTLDELRWITETLRERGIADAPVVTLIPALTTAYRRRTVQYTQPQGAPVSRLTIDVDLACGLPATCPNGPLEIDFDRFIVVETKGAARPSRVDRVLWSMGHRPLHVSKYGLGTAALRPDVPELKWHHVLNRYLA
ncbi:MAG: VTC domain-containing protein [Brooklawnia sp.]|uniref:VTC domain-containing protein n=1 Tax=Brooklawnia sp. TaxID=2699740 RepID=UPI003C7940EB